MKIKSLRVQNLRSFKDETIEFNDYTCLVGPNGSGKSTVLCALNIFFRDSEGYSTDLTLLDSEDFHHKNTDDPIIITVTFVDLNDEAKNDFENYYRHNQLVISAIAKFDLTIGRAEVKQYGERFGLEAFKPFFKAEGDNKKVAELKILYDKIRKDYPGLPSPGTKDAMIQALHSYETEHLGECVLIPSEDQFYGVSKGENRLSKYIQWVHVPAVKDATDEQTETKNTALGKLLVRTVRAKVNFTDQIKDLEGQAQVGYKKILDDNQDALNEISRSLEKRLSEWSHPDTNLKLEWHQEPEKAVRVDPPMARIIAGEGAFKGNLARFGHGFQRSYLLALLQELSGSDDKEGPKLILSCEEPELYQHPPQARHLFNVFKKLSQGNSQILICTHSPYFVSGESFEDIRFIRKEKNSSTVSFSTYEAVAEKVLDATGEKPIKPEGALAKINQALQITLSEMFFTPNLVLVEGLEDYAYITSYLSLLDLWDEYRRLGVHIVPTDGKSGMIQALAIAKALEIPTFVLFDSDGDKPDRNGSKVRHEKDNTAILKLCGYDTSDPFPKDTFWGNRVVMWNSEIGTVVESDIGKSEWKNYQDRADRMYGQVGNLHKNMLHIGTCLALAWNEGEKTSHLEKFCREIIKFGKMEK